MTLFLTLLFIFFATPIYANTTPDYENLADAIHIAENGINLNLGEQYGIHSVHYENRDEARAICIRTCKHAWKNHTGDWLTFLSKRYCPYNWKVWKRNVEYYYLTFSNKKNTIKT